MPRRDAATLDLFAYEPPRVAVGFEADVVRGSRLSNRISQAIAKALKDCPLSRAKISEKMSAELGYRISEDQINAWSSQAKEAHKISLERFIALIEVTECHDLLGFVAEMFGFVVVPARYRPIIELHLIEEHEREVMARKERIQAELKSASRRAV